jgi:hypothetical protein
VNNTHGFDLSWISYASFDFLRPSVWLAYLNVNYREIELYMSAGAIILSLISACLYQSLCALACSLSVLVLYNDF